MAIYKLNSKKKKETSRNTKKIVGFSLIGAASVVFLFLTGIVKPLQVFFLGLFGVFGYPLCIILFVVGLALVNNRRYVMSKKYTICLILAVFFTLCILQLAIVGNKGDLGFWQYMAKNYTNTWTAGGILIGFFTTIFLYVANLVGSYIIFALALIICVALLVDSLNHLKKQKTEDEPVSVLIKDKNEKETVLAEKEKFKDPEPATNIVLNGNLQEEAQKDQQRSLTTREILGLDKKRDKAYGEQAPVPEKPVVEEKPKSLKELLLTPPKIDLDEYFKDVRSQNKAPQKSEIEQNVSVLKNANSEVGQEVGAENVVQPQLSSDLSADIVDEKPQEKLADEFVPDPSPIVSSLNDVDGEEVVDFADDIIKSAIEEEKQENPDVFEEAVDPETNVINSIPIRDESGSFGGGRGRFENPRDGVRPQLNGGRGHFDVPIPKPQEEQTPAKKEPYVYTKPPIDLITTKSVDLSTLNEDVATKRVLLENTLETFGVPAKVQGVVVGPAVTRYELEMPQGVSVSKIKNRADDMALSLAAEGSLRIEAPVPGKSVVGVEVPNSSIATISLKDVLSSKEFMQSSSPLTFALGKDITGNIMCCNMQKLTHLLVAGSTGSGKSVCLNSIILSIMYKASPEDVKIVLIDPKRVEFANYEALPHLVMPKIVCDTQKAINTLAWAVAEMERRFEMMGFARVKNIDEYNQTADVTSGKVEKMPFIVIIVDELADLMMTGKKEVEEKVCRLAQKSRAAGIHLILATQRPSVDVITGLIKSNFPSRIAFKVTSAVDSMTILDRIGAEKLLGKGDMLYYPVGAQEPKRVQGCFITTGEINNIVDFTRDNNEPIFDKEIEEKIENPNQGNKNGVPGVNNEMDELLPVVLKMFVECGQASITMIRRRFAIGYARAARIIDQMEQANYISTADGVKGRTVYITEEEFKEIFGEQYEG